MNLGGDPNLLADTGRSPLFRAAFNGHESTVLLLLEAGGDPTIFQKTDGSAPTDVAKTDEVRVILAVGLREDYMILSTRVCVVCPLIGDAPVLGFCFLVSWSTCVYVCCMCFCW